MRALLRSDGERLVTITGRGGVGKSSLALEVGAAELAAGERDVVVVPLQDVEDATTVLDEVVDAMGIRVPGDDARDALVRRFARTPTLLVLDNAEHVVDAGVAINELIGRSPALTVLVTSQRRLGVRDERVVPLRPLPVPPVSVTDLAELRATPAVALYLDRVAAVVGPDHPGPDVAAAAELCRRLDGLPLAIELAAARAGLRTAEDLVAGSAGVPLDLLGGGPSDAPARHRDLRAALAWTCGLLPVEAQRLLLAVAVLRTPFDLEVAAALAEDRGPADVIDDLSTLVDLHLIDPVGAGSFELPSSIREYAAEQLGVDDRAEVAGRYVAWCAATDGCPTAQLADALRLALDAGDTRHAHELLERVGPSWNRARVRHDQRDLVDRLLAQPVDEDLPPTTRGRTLLWSVNLDPPMATSRDREAILTALGEAESIARSVGDDDLLLRAIAARLLVAPTIGGATDADALVVEATAIASRSGEPWWVARCELWAGVTAQRRFDFDAATTHGLAALRIARDLHDDALLAYASMLLGPLRELAPALASEVPTLDEALVLVRRSGLLTAETFILPMLLDDVLDGGDVERATALGIEALDLVAGSADSPALAANLMAAARVAHALGDDEVAAHAHGAIVDGLDGLLATLPPVRIARYERTIDGVRRSLGLRFDEGIRAGASSQRTDVVEEVLALLRRDRPRRTVEPVGTGTGTLTPRETDVLLLLGTGLTNKEIGVSLSLRPKTVMHHTSAIYRKLGVRGRSEAIVWAAARGLTADA